MDFFQAQDSAKKITHYLILVYVLVLFALTVLSSLVLVFLLPITIGQPIPEFSAQTLLSDQYLPVFFGVGAFIIGGALISSYFKSRHLSKGGAVVAASLGAIKICSNTRDLNERKLLNVVEEMAIASGMPVPDVYLLKQEMAINAFAAGQTPVDAVIGVTQGAVDRLSRAQLQGVIAHEFSHILNGDMRLNLRIIMMLHGVEFISLLGRILTHSNRRSRYGRSRGKSNGIAVIAGIALLIIGWVGVLFGSLIKAAVSRQREFLADASAVQFTRDPSTIADALRVIGHVSSSSRINSAELNEISHMFFVQSFTTRFSSLFATHPPIEQRIQAVYPQWDGAYLAPLPVSDTAVNSSENGKNHSTASISSHIPAELNVLIAAGLVLSSLNDQQQAELVALVEQTKEPLESMALIFATFVHGQKKQGLQPATEQDAWYRLLQKEGQPGLLVLVDKNLQLLEQQQEGSASLLLTLVELSLPALKQMSAQQYHEFKRLMTQVIDLDGHQSVFEQTIYLLVTRFLDVYYGLVDVNKVRFHRAAEVGIELNLVFSCLVYYAYQPLSVAGELKEGAYQVAMQHLALGHLTLIDPDNDYADSLSLEREFNQAVERLVYCSLPLKHKIVEAISLAIEFNGHISEIERDLALAIAATMDAPLPRL